MKNAVKNRNNCLDFIRGTACLFIIFIHRPFPGTFGFVISALARAGVAVFFIISGYYTYNIDSSAAFNRMWHKIKHAGVILLYALLYYLLWEAFIRWAGTGFSSTYDWIKNNVLNPYTWYFALVWDRDPFAGHLWYLFALLRCYLLFYVLLKFRLEKYSHIISIVCLTGTLAMQKANIELLYFRNGWFYGMGFFLIGYVIASNKIKSSNVRVVYLGILVGLFLSTIGGVIYPNKQIYVGTIVLSVSLFVWAITQEADFSDVLVINKLAKIGVQYGTLIYVIHWSIKECFIKLDKSFAFTQQVWYLWVSPIMLAALSILFCKVFRFIIRQLFTTARIKR